ncbi:MAG TPA: molybdopterin-guanine dinucleotide biosynthesis protein B [Longimicrobiales bacterium]|nr:molybdopterin-guanine dinucleotide biosynthesis protein B [Longimicrobiales bacterium]
MPGPPLVCVVGKKKSGKTAVVLKLVAELERRGRRVMTIKHGHAFDLDRPGTDSWRHRSEGGAERVVLAGPGQFAILGSWPAGDEVGPAELAARHLAEADIVVVEGFKQERAPKIEVFRRAAHDHPVYDPAAPTAPDYIAGVTDDDGYAARVPFPTFSLADPEMGARLADLVEAAVLSPG